MRIMSNRSALAGFVLAATVTVGAPLAASAARVPDTGTPATAQAASPAPSGLAMVLPGAGVQQPATQEEFVPASQLPAVEQMPAAPMVIAAYAFVWVALLAYVWSLWRRVQHLGRDLSELERRIRTEQES